MSRAETLGRRYRCARTIALFRSASCALRSGRSPLLDCSFPITHRLKLPDSHFVEHLLSHPIDHRRDAHSPGSRIRYLWSPFRLFP